MTFLTQVYEYRAILADFQAIKNKLLAKKYQTQAKARLFPHVWFSKIQRI